MSGAVEIVAGLVAGILSGAFGVGGGVITTPAIRLLLGYPPLVAVGTPLVVVVPTAMVGALAYLARKAVDLRVGLILGAIGAVTALVGARVSVLLGGPAVLVLTGVLMIFVAWRLARDDDSPAPRRFSRSARLIVPLGLLGGFASGLLGVGGGFLFVPGLVLFMGLDAKKAFGTSLVAISVLAVPGSIGHAFLGHVDWALAVRLTIGVVPGVLVGARLAVVTSERVARVGFVALLALAGIVLILEEMGAMSVV